MRTRRGLAARTDHHAAVAQLHRHTGQHPFSAAAARPLCLQPLQPLHPPPRPVQAYAARNRNRGAALCASADLISFIDADDLMLPDRLAVRTVLLHTLYPTPDPWP